MELYLLFTNSNAMRYFLVTILFLCAIVATAQTKPYEGAWFSVKYPANFSVQNGLSSGSNGGTKFDSATFTSPDKTVTFYVFSPLWPYEPTDIELKGGEERLAPDTIGNTVSFYSYYSAKDKRTHSYQVTRDVEGNISLVIGIRYPSMKVYEKYRQQYLAFKKSVTQYAD